MFTHLVKRASILPLDVKCFAMLNCAASISGTGLEGLKSITPALKYIQSLVTTLQETHPELLSQKQYQIAKATLDSLLYFDTLIKCASMHTFNIDEFRQKIVQRCDENKTLYGTPVCYIPSGWTRHFNVLKVERNPEGLYILSFIDQGAGLAFHSPMSAGRQKAKYDYQSLPYSIDLSSDFANPFLFGFVNLQHGQGQAISIDSYDLYALLEIYGTRCHEKAVDESHAVTPQRTGTCTITNTRGAIRDALLSYGDVEANQIKRFNAFVKFASIITMGHHLGSVQSFDEYGYQLYSYAMRELYVRLEKLVPENLSPEEADSILKTSERISKPILTQHNQWIEQRCKKIPPPDTMIWDYHAGELVSLKPIKPEDRYLTPAVNQEKRLLQTRECSPETIMEYISKTVDYFNGSEKFTVERLYNMQRFVRSLPKASGETADSFWDKVPTQHLEKIVLALDTFLDDPKEINPELVAVVHEIGLLVYDIVAQIAPRIPTLKMGNTYTLGLDDFITYKSGYSDTQTFYNISRVMKNFEKRSIDKIPLFNHSMILDSKLMKQNGIHAYIMQFVDKHIRKDIAASLGIKRHDQLTDHDIVCLLLTMLYQQYDSQVTLKLEHDLPKNLRSIMRIATKAQNNLNPRGYLANKYYPNVDGQVIRVFVDPIPFEHHERIAIKYTHAYKFSQTDSIKTWFESTLPDQGRLKNGAYHDFMENTRYLPNNQVNQLKQILPIRREELPWNYDNKTPYDTELDVLAIDPQFTVSRILEWGYNYPDRLREAGVRKALEGYLFKYGAFWLSLSNTPDETIDIMIRFFNETYDYYKNNTVVLLWLVYIESCCRDWISTLPKAQALSVEFPLGISLLKNHLQADTPEVAWAILYNANYWGGWNQDDYNLILFCRLVVGDKYFNNNQDVAHFKSIVAWERIKEQSLNYLRSLSSEKLSHLANDILNQYGLKQYISKTNSWLLLEDTIRSKNDQVIISFSRGTIIANKQEMSNAKALFKNNDIFSVLEIDPNQIDIFPIPPSQRINRCNYQTGDGKYLFSHESQNTIDKVYTWFTIARTPILFQLATRLDEQNTTSLGMAKQYHKNLHPKWVQNPRYLLWISLSGQLFIQDKKKPKNAWFNSGGIWQKLHLNEHQGYDLGSKGIITQKNGETAPFNAYIQAISSCENPVLTMDMDYEHHSMMLKSVYLPDYNLQFIRDGYELMSKEFFGYHWINQTAIPALNGLQGIIMLQNSQGQQLFLLPIRRLNQNAPNPFYNTQPVSNELVPKLKESYYVLTEDDFGRLIFPHEEAYFYGAIVYAAQGDFNNAMRCLKRSETHIINSEFILQMTVDYLNTNPSSPLSAAFICHLHSRIMEHDHKWQKSFVKPEKYTEMMTLITDKSRNAFERYKNSESLYRESVMIIPSELRLNIFALSDYTDKHRYVFDDPIMKNTETANAGSFDVRPQNVLFSGKLPEFPSIRYEKPEHFIKEHYSQLIKLALSTEVKDILKFRATVYYLQRSLVETMNSQSDHLNGLLFIHQNPERFKDIKQSGNISKAKELMLEEFPYGVEAKNKPFFSQKQIETPSINILSLPSQLKHNTAQFVLTDKGVLPFVNHPLKELIGIHFVVSDKLLVNFDEFPLAPKERQLSALERHIYEGYKKGFESIKGKKKTIYSIATTQLEPLKQDLQLLKEQDEQSLRSIENSCDLIIQQYDNSSQALVLAKKSEHLPQLTMVDIVTSLMTQNTTTLLSKVPLLTQEDVNEILLLGMNYCLTSTRIQQINEALALLGDDSNDKPDWLGQVLGEIIDKQRHYKIHDYPEFLFYEFSAKKMLRADQANILIKLFEIIETKRVSSEEYRHVLLQFAAAGGKTAVLIPLLAFLFIKQGIMPIIVNTNELYQLGMQEIPASLRETLSKQIEILEIDLSFNFTELNADKILADLKRWQENGKILYVKAVTWHAINISRKMAHEKNDVNLERKLNQILDFFKMRCIKLEDEGHIISDPMQICIRTDDEMLQYSSEELQLYLRFYDYLMGHEKEGARLVELTQLGVDSRKKVSLVELEEVQDILIKLMSKEPCFSMLNLQDLEAYWRQGSAERAPWLVSLHHQNPLLANLVVGGRSFIKKHLGFLLDKQYLKDYGASIHPDDLTAAPKHEGQPVEDHFGDPLTLIAITIQYYHQNGVPHQYAHKIIKKMVEDFKREKHTSSDFTEAEFRLLSILPLKYHLTNLYDLDNQAILTMANDRKVRLEPSLIRYFLTIYVFPQIKIPKKRYTSTPAEFQDGFIRSIIFSATPGLLETYPIPLKRNHFLAAPEFEAEVISTLMSPHNSNNVLLDKVTTPYEFFSKIQDTNPNAFKTLTTLIDRGALLANDRIDEIKEAYLKLLEDDLNRANILYYADGGMMLESKKQLKNVALKGTRILEALQAQGFQLEEVIIFLFIDLARTTGFDMKRPYQDIAGVTIGKEQTLTETIQGAMRERQLLKENAQSIIWIAFKELYQLIHPNDVNFDLNDIFFWMIANQARKDEHKIIMRAYHGLAKILTDAALEQGVDAPLSSEVSIFSWDIYELVAELKNTEIVLNSYVKSMTEQLKIDAKRISVAHQTAINHIIDETKALIIEMMEPHGSELSATVVQEQTIHEQINENQNTHLQEQVLCLYHSGNHARLAYECYDSTDDLTHIYSGNRPSYAPFSIPDFMDINLPILLINKNQFTPIESSNPNYPLLKPIHNILVRISPMGEFQYLACTMRGAEFFVNQLKNKKPHELDAVYVLLSDSKNPLYKSSNFKNVHQKAIKNEAGIDDMIAWVGILNGKIINATKASALINKYQISKEQFIRITAAVQRMHVALEPVELENRPYFEALCSWKNISSDVVEKMNQRSALWQSHTKAIPSRVCQIRFAPPTTPYLPQPMYTELSPCFLGKENKPRSILAIKEKEIERTKVVVSDQFILSDFETNNTGDSYFLIQKCEHIASKFVNQIDVDVLNSFTTTLGILATQPTDKSEKCSKLNTFINNFKQFVELVKDIRLIKNQYTSTKNKNRTMVIDELYNAVETELNGVKVLPWYKNAADNLTQALQKALQEVQTDHSQGFFASRFGTESELATILQGIINKHKNDTYIEISNTFRY